MNKIVNFIKKNYIYINVTFLLLVIYIILFPIIETPIKQIIPNFNECIYLKSTGKPCPLCGGTRYIKNLPNAFTDITYLFHPFGAMAIVIFLEGIFRTYNIINRKKQRSDKWIKIDLFIHIIIVICFFSYIIGFMILQQK